MILSQRLQRVAAQVPEGAVLADIGTDHGLLPIWLMEQGKISEAFACDVRQGPLSRAREHIQEAGLTEKIHTLLSNGLDALKPGQADTAVIAGMGGRLTAQIIEGDQARNRQILSGLEHLILQPQSEWDRVRRAVHACGFRIINEEMVKEREKYYLIIHSCPGKERYTEEEYAWGRWLEKKKDTVFRQYLYQRDNKNQRLLERLEQAEETGPLCLRRQKLCQDQQRIRRILEQWQ